MVKLEDYYQDLVTFLRENRLISQQTKKDQVPCSSRELKPVLIPLTAFLLASKQCVHERIERFFSNYWKEPEDKKYLDGIYEEVNVPELEFCLTLSARIIYRKLLLMFLTQTEQHTERILKLLKTAYPLSYIDEEGVELEASLLVGDYDVRNAVVTYLVLYLSGVVFFENQGNYSVELVYQQFERAYLTNVPLPFWLSQDKTEHEHIAFQLSELVNRGYQSLEEPWYEKSYQSAQELRAQSELSFKHNNCAIKVQKDSVEDYAQILIPTAVIADKANNPNIRYRLAKKTIQPSGILFFLHEILSAAYISREELLDCNIPDDVGDWINRAFTKSKEAGFNLELEECQLLAGIIYTILNRTRNAEELADVLLTQSSPAMLQAHQETEDELNDELTNLKEELLESKRKNEELKASLASLNKKANDESRQWLLKEELMRHNYQSLKQDFEQLIETKDEEEAPEADEIKLEEMKNKINKEKILFVGGHPSWQNAMKAEFPHFRFIGPKEYTAAAPSVFKDIDFIVYNVNWNNHGMYYKCLKQKGNATRFLFIRSNNTKHSIWNIYKKIEAGDAANVV